MNDELACAIKELLPGDGPAVERARQDAARTARFLLADPEEPPLALRFGHWRIDAQRSLVQAAAASSVLALAVHEAGLTSVPVALLALILPFLVDVERVELRPSEKLLLAALRENADTGGDAAQWYASLPRELQAQLTMLEFADALEHLRAAGAIVSREADTLGFPDAAHGYLRLRRPGDSESSGVGRG
jgi:hypothetical protein